MQYLSASLSSRVISTLVLLTTVGCSFGGIEPPAAIATPAPSLTVEPEASPEATPTVEDGHDETTPEPAEPGLDTIPVTSNALYGDNFTDPATGWAEAKFDNYFIGYHEPESYHLEVGSPSYKTTVFVPEKPSFSDATIEVKAAAYSAKTAADGDFIFGPVFRRSGDQYYAFTISPRSKTWSVLKSSPSELTTLAEGTDTSIHDLDANDTLRVDMQGSTFFFHINGRLVGQVSDPDYASGEVGFYVQTFDSPQTHIHFDELTIWDFEAPGMCTISTTAKLNVRNGPGTNFPASTSLSEGDTVEPFGHSSDGDWIKIGLQGSEEEGWIANSPDYVTCNIDITTLPVIIDPQ